MSNKTIVHVLTAERDAFKWGYRYLKDRMRSIARNGWAQDCEGEIEARIAAAQVSASTSCASYKTTLFTALKSAGTVICDGYEIDTQINGDILNKPGWVMLQCSDDYTVIFPDQEIEVDESGSGFAIDEDGLKVSLDFMVTIPMQEDSLLKSNGVPA